MSKSNDLMKNGHFYSWMRGLRLAPATPEGMNRMVTTHNLGFPRIGARRQLKFGLEQYWRGEISEADLEALAAAIRRQGYESQRGLDLVPVGDFSLYDHVLDLSFLLGNFPTRVSGRSLDDYFRVARGRAPGDTSSAGIPAAEMTKWFNTNYHYIVPEFSEETVFSIDASRLLRDINEAQDQGFRAKPVLVGPVTYLWLGKSRDERDKLTLLPALLVAYRELLSTLQSAGIEWVQIDEPILTMDLDKSWVKALRESYDQLSYGGPRLLLGTYFGELKENIDLAVGLPVHGIHLDMIRGQADLPKVHALLPESSILSLGVVDGRNIWKTDLEAAIDQLVPLAQKKGDNLWIAPACSLLHVPVDLDQEEHLDPEVKSWLAFAVQKLEEIEVLGKAINHTRASVKEQLAENRAALAARRQSPRVNHPAVRAAVARLDSSHHQRKSPYALRREIQRKVIELPPLPTTTIGSFPQTDEIRKARRQFRAGAINETTYTKLMQNEIARAVREQETIGLDVLVHGEAERNDMVEYFGEQLDGYVFSEYGWVQSYGSRCVKPPILFGDVQRKQPMTVEWTKYAQSLTQRPVKGMLTGPITILNWSFVRDDKSRSECCVQLALAIRDEVLDLEAAGTQIVQIDEAALREGLPLRKAEWKSYLQWAVESFRIASSGVKDETQIHTHMCYSEFNDIIEAIAQLDADVITIETSRSNMELLNAFNASSYPNDIGPGVYDIHSPNVPSVAQIVELITSASEKFPVSRLWINPDCGLKTRSWGEVRGALGNMVEAARTLRQNLAPALE